MPSEYQKKKLAKKKEAAKVKGGKKNVAKEGSPANDDSGTSTPRQNGSSSVNGAAKDVPLTYEEELCKRLEEEAALAADARACTGVLGIHPMSRDIKIDNLSVTFHGSELLVDTKLELSVGQR